MISRSSRFSQIPLWICLIGSIFILSIAFFIGAAPTYDDWLYAGVFTGAEPIRDSWREYPRWCVSHWLTTNGRWGNYCLPVMPLMPAVPRALICAIAVAAMYALAVMCSRKTRGWIPVALCTAICMAMPWWDYMMAFACQTNYVWASVMLLWFFYILFGKSDRIKWWEWPIAVLGGMGHEAGSLPMLCGIIAYFILNRHSIELSKARTAFIIIFAVSTMATVLSPGILNRAVSGGATDDTPLMIFLKSDIIAGALWLTLAILACFKQSRHKVVALLRNPESVLLWGTFVATAISIYGGIVGRSGWFAELYALIVFTYLVPYNYNKPRCGLAIALALITVTQLSITAYWQLKLGMQHNDFIVRYAKSTDGIVWVDGLLRDNDAPWTALSKAKGIPDADDIGQLEALSRYFHADSVSAIAMPSDARQFIPLKKPKAELTNGDLLLKELPCDAITYSPIEKYPPCYLFNRGGETWTAVYAAGCFYCSPLVLDPGDRTPTR